jgi:dynein heavy chain
MGYKRVAVRGSILYFVIADMARINDMYQNSLEYVKVLFNKAIDMTPKSDELETRLDSLIDVSTKTIFTNVSRGLFSRDKLIFSFLICTSIDRNNLEINNVAWNIMLRGAIPISDAQKAKMGTNPFPKNILSDQNQELLYSSEINLQSSYEGLTEDLVINNKPWLAWATCDNPQTE